MTVPGNLSSPLLATAADAAAAGPTRSLRFNSGDSAYLSRTPSSNGNRRTFTFSCWVKRSKPVPASSGQELFRAGDSALSAMNFAPSDGPVDSLSFKADQGGVSPGSATNAVFRDFSAWMHVVYRIDTTQATAADRVRIYVNGVEQTFHTANYPSQNQELKINQSGQPHYIGGKEYFDGYLADIYLIDGSSLDPTSFAAYDDNGVWQAAAYSGTFGTNGFHLKFDDVSSAAALGTDSSGNSNTFTVNNLVHAGGVAAAGARSAAVLFDGTDDSISFTNNSDLNPGNGTFTLECFVYKQPGQQVVVYYGTGVGQAGFRVLGNSKLGVERINQAFDLQTGNTVPENQWVHVAWVRSGTTIKGYINGQEAGSATTSQTYQGTFVTAKTLGSGDFNNMVISDLHLVKGTALYTTSSFTPPTTISAHANTKLLCFQNASSATTATVKPSGVTLTASSSPVAGAYPTTEHSDVDAVFDAPTNGDQSDTGAGGEVSGNYCTINPLLQGANTNIANGNLEINSTSSTWNNCFGTIAIPTSGKWYWEVEAGGANTQPGITPASDDLASNVGTYPSNNLNFRGYYGPSGNKITGPGAGSASYGATFTTGDIIGIAFDAGAGSLTFYKNGVSQGVAFTGLTGEYIPIFGTFDTGVQKINFGQRAFAYSAPSDYKALCTTNLPTPTIADGSDYFDTLTWTGANGGTTRSFTGLSFSPDWVWTKTRSLGFNHQVYDSVRGAGNDKSLASNDASAEPNGAPATYGYLSSFDSAGFTFTKGTSTGDPAGNAYFDQVIGSAATYVGWCWDAGANSNKTYTVKVVSDSGNKYRFDDFGTSAVTLDLAEGSTYVFDQSDSSNSGHPLRFSTTSNGTHNSGSEYTTGVTVTGTPGSAGAKTTIVIPAGTVYSDLTSGGAVAGSYPMTQAFDGSTSTAGVRAVSGGGFVFGGSLGISYSSSVRIHSGASGIGTQQFKLNDGTATDMAENTFVTVASGSGTLNKLEITAGSTGNANIYLGAVEVDGVILQDNSSTPTLYYYCSAHSGMGGQANTNSTAGASNFDGSIQSTVKANPEAGFSIVTWTNSSGGTATIGHGLNDALAFYTIKRRDASTDWDSFHSAAGNTKGIALNNTNAAGTGSGYWNNTSPTSSVFTVGSGVQASSANYVAYCFAPVSGFSAFGSFEGGNPFVYLGFRPALIFCKSIDSNARNWLVFDSTRSPDNPDKKYLTWDGNGAEGSYNACDFLSNGFKVKASGSQELGFSGETYIYGAWAVNPFSANGGLAL